MTGVISKDQLPELQLQSMDSSCRHGQAMVQAINEEAQRGCAEGAALLQPRGKVLVTPMVTPMGGFLNVPCDTDDPQ